MSSLFFEHSQILLNSFLLSIFMKSAVIESRERILEIVNYKKSLNIAAVE